MNSQKSSTLSEDALAEAALSTTAVRLDQRPVGDRVERGTQRQLRPLTGLRFVAALGVVVYHYVYFFSQPAGSQGLPPQSALGRLIYQGALGVDFFFLLSGFILAYTYVTSAGVLRTSRRAFWVARLARIYPVFLVGLALDLIPFVTGPHHLLGILASLVAQPLLLQAWLPSSGGINAWNPPSWSLSVEACFYLLFPLLVVALARLSSRRLVRSAALAWVVYAVLPALIILLGPGHAHPVPWWLDYIVEFNPLLRLPEFITGLALGLVFVRRARAPSAVPASWTSWTRWADPAALALAAVYLTITALPLHVLPSYPFGVLVIPVLAALIYLLAHEHGYVARVLSTRLMLWLGEISYGIYILHWPIWAYVAAVGHNLLHLPLDAPILVCVYPIVLIAAAGLSYRYIEQPARRAIRTRWAQREQRGHPPTVLSSRAGADAAALR